MDAAGDSLERGPSESALMPRTTADARIARRRDMATTRFFLLIIAIEVWAVASIGTAELHTFRGLAVATAILTWWRPTSGATIVLHVVTQCALGLALGFPISLNLCLGLIAAALLRRTWLVLAVAFVFAISFAPELGWHASMVNAGLVLASLVLCYGLQKEHHALAHALQRQRERSRRVRNGLDRELTAVESQKAELLEASRAQEEFLANVSHEVRTPMTAILGYTDLLSAEDLPIEDRRNYLASIRSSGSHLLTIINDILDLSKIRAGDVGLKVEECSLVRLLADVVSTTRPRAQAKQLELAVEFNGPVPRRVTTDPTRLRQVLLNLMSNAIKFTDEGWIRIIVRSATENGRSTVWVSVADTGPGIAPEDLDRIFEPFVQADTSATRRHGGTGLGLAICQSFATMLGGEITARSTVGQGSSFALRFDPGPIDPDDLTDDANSVLVDEASVSERKPGKLTGRALIVDDGADNRILMSAMLRKMGLKVTTANDGKEGLDVFFHAKSESQPFDVVLMDMQMPRIDGYDATRTLRERGETTPVLAVTAHAMAGDREKCIEAGCTDYTAKPVDPARLRRALRDLLVDS